MLKIYDYKTKSKKEFIPIKEGEVSLYVCGPTLYGDIHIGNARPIVFFDIVFRYLSKIGYNVKYVSNITDIDDKIINKAEELKISEAELVGKNFIEYEDILDKLNIRRPDQNPTVVEYIQDIMFFVSDLIDRDYAYLTENGDVYFRVSKVKEYGEISNRNIDDLMEGVRIDVDNLKESPTDFALWKKTDKGIVWEAPFGVGRPGWHTECAVMIKEIFHSKIDIHGGGVDLKFPHHENENAQFKALEGDSIANFWMHNGFLNIDGEKMSKSIGNVFLVKDFLKQFTPNVLRLVLLQTNYRQPVNLTDDFIKQTEKLLAKIEEFSNSVYWDEAALTATKPLDEKIVEIMDDDFNTPNLISLLLEVIKENDKNSYVQILDLLGLRVSFCLKIENLKPEILALYKDFEQYRNAKEFNKLDLVKEQLNDLGYKILVTRQGLRIKEVEVHG